VKEHKENFLYSFNICIKSFEEKFLISIKLVCLQLRKYFNIFQNGVGLEYKNFKYIKIPYKNSPSENYCTFILLFRNKKVNFSILSQPLARPHSTVGDSDFSGYFLSVYGPCGHGIRIRLEERSGTTRRGPR